MPGATRSAASYLGRVPLAIANSTAAARVLQLLWDYAGDVRVCRNALRPERRSGRADASSVSRTGAIKLGAAARLYPVKGLAIVLHAVASLRAQRPSLDAELHVAGAGPELAAPARVGRQLGHCRDA